MENHSLPSGNSNEEMGFVIDKKKPIKPYASIATSWWWPTVKPFVNGGIAKLATDSQFLLFNCVCYYSLPYIAFDQKNSALVKKTLPSNERFKVFLKHMPAALLFQATIRGLTIGSFEILTKKAVAANGGTPPSIYQEACCGLLAGVVGASISSPLRFAYSCMRADASLPVAQRLNYRNIFDALYHIGAKALWKGGAPSAKAEIAYHMGMVASYNRSLNYFMGELGFDESKAQQGAGAVSGFFAVACSSPFSNVLAHMQNMKPNTVNGKYPYSSFLDCALKILKARGLSGFFKGFPTSLASKTPNIMVTWIIFEELQKSEESNGW